jgi:3-phosphoglycerate kinase
VIWNGPMGVFEFDKFAAGTNGIAHTLADLSGKAAARSSAVATRWQPWKRWA